MKAFAAALVVSITSAALGLPEALGTMTAVLAYALTLAWTDHAKRTPPAPVVRPETWTIEEIYQREG